MLSDWAAWAAVVLYGPLVGNEFAVMAFFHPQLVAGSAEAHREVAARLAGVTGRWMPVWYALALTALAAASAADFTDGRSAAGGLLAGAAVLHAAVIVFTVARMVPINARVAGLAAQGEPPPDWLELRACWDRMHRGRVAALAAAWLLAAAGAICC